MHVLSGSRFDIDGPYTPTVEDIAQGLIGIPRWAGATIIPWSVLHHSLSVAGLLEEQVGRDKVTLFGLWHDAAEFAIGDIPSPHKTTEQRWLEQEIQEKLIRQTLRVTPPDAATEATVKVADDMVKNAEARVLAHPQAWEDFEEEGEMWEMEAVDEVWKLLRIPDYVLVDRFISKTHELLETVGQRRG